MHRFCSRDMGQTDGLWHHLLPIRHIRWQGWHNRNFVCGLLSEINVIDMMGMIARYLA